MVRNREEIIEELRRVYDQMKQSSLHSRDHAAPLSRVVTELFSLDSFYAGCADTLLDSDRLPREFLPGLRDPFPLEGGEWKMENGDVVDISGNVEILSLARLLKHARDLMLRLEAHV